VNEEGALGPTALTLPIGVACKLKAAVTTERSPGSEGFADRAVQGEQGPHAGHGQG
jgi:hypothetical protein